MSFVFLSVWPTHSLTRGSTQRRVWQVYTESRASSMLYHHTTFARPLLACFGCKIRQKKYTCRLAVIEMKGKAKSNLPTFLIKQLFPFRATLYWWESRLLHIQGKLLILHWYTVDTSPSTGARDVTVTWSQQNGDGVCYGYVGEDLCGIFLKYKWFYALKRRSAFVSVVFTYFCSFFCVRFVDQGQGGNPMFNRSCADE